MIRPLNTHAKHPMTKSHHSPMLIKRSFWLALCVGGLAQFALKLILPFVVLFGIRLFSLTTENNSLWLEHPNNSSHPVWYVLQGAVFLGACLAGWLAAWLSPGKSRLLPMVLILLSLIATGFEQFPMPMSSMVMFIWAGAPCAGLFLGWLLPQLPGRSSNM